MRRVLYATRPVSALSKKAEINQALNHAIRTVTLAQKLELKGGKLAFSKNLSAFTGSKTYVQTGYDEYEGDIEGHAALGYFAEYMAPIYNALLSLDKEGQDLRKANFLIGHGIERPNGLTKEVDLFHVALWESFKDKPVICPSSGSFAYGFLETLQKFRTTAIAAGNHSFMLFQSAEYNKKEKSEGEVVPFLPHPGLPNIMPPEKQAYISAAALKVGSKPEYWTEDRDLISFIYTLARNGFYCSTNPKSVDEVRELVEEVGARKGYEFIETHKAALAAMGVSVQRNNGTVTITIHSPMSGSIYGLMGVKLDAMESLLQDPSIVQESTFNQPSAGSTLAASALLNLALANPDEISIQNKELIGQYFPHIHKALILGNRKIKSELYGCFDTANPALAKKLGYEGIIYNSDGMAVNGLGSFSTSDESVRWLMEAKSSREPTFAGGKGMLVCPHNLMQIARVILFADGISMHGKEARYPESAGAAGLGGWLHQQISGGSKKPREIAYFLRSNGVSMEIFEKLVDLRYFTEESEKHGGQMAAFSKDFLQAMSPTVPIAALLQRGHAQQKNAVDPSKALVFVNTGSNGTERYQQYTQNILESQKQQDREHPVIR